MAETTEKHIESPAESKPAESSTTQAILGSVDAPSMSVGAMQDAPLEADEAEPVWCLFIHHVWSTDTGKGNDATSIDDRMYVNDIRMS